MGLGLQVFSETGTTVLDITTRVGRVVAVFNTNSANGSMVIPELSNGGTPFSFIDDNSADLNRSNLYAYPSVSINGNTVSWVYTDFNYPRTSTKVPRRPVNITIGTA